jgi:hypothetical protein
MKAAKGPGRGGLVNANDKGQDDDDARGHKDADTGRRRTPPGVGTILDPIMEEPVSYGEMERLRFVREVISLISLWNNL